MKKLPLVLFIAFISALFCSGMTTVAVPLIVPGSVAITSAAVCPDGMRAKARPESYTDSEGTHTSAVIECTDGTQVVPADSTKSLLVFMGIVFAPMFLVLYVLVFIFLKPVAPGAEAIGMPSEDEPKINTPLNQKLEELKQAYESNLISAEEYDTKRQALLDQF